MELDIELIFNMASYILTGVFALLWSYCKYYTLPKTKEQLEASLSAGAKVVETIKSIVAFFDPEEPMSKTSIETIREYIPAGTYQMSDESQARVLSYCASEEEKQRVLTEIYNWENPQATGEECTEYTLVTSGGTFHVQWGVPELVSKPDNDYTYLTQKQIAELCGMLPDAEAVDVLYQILSNERRLEKEYDIAASIGRIEIRNGVYEIIQ